MAPSLVRSAQLYLATVLQQLKQELFANSQNFQFAAAILCSPRACVEPVRRTLNTCRPRARPRSCRRHLAFCFGSDLRAVSGTLWVAPVPLWLVVSFLLFISFLHRDEGNQNTWSCSYQTWMLDFICRVAKFVSRERHSQWPQQLHSLWAAIKPTVGLAAPIQSMASWMASNCKSQWETKSKCANGVLIKCATLCCEAFIFKLICYVLIV